MKMHLRILLVVVFGFALSLSAQAANLDSAEHPYCAIAATNVFRLKPPPEFKLPEEPPKPPPPKITLQGITTISGYPEVLFKVSTATKLPEPARETAYILRERQREGEIEVLEINVQSGTATFRNHGVEQVLALKRLPGVRSRVDWCVTFEAWNC